MPELCALPTVLWGCFVPVLCGLPAVLLRLGVLLVCLRVLVVVPVELLRCGWRAGVRAVLLPEEAPAA